MSFEPANLRSVGRLGLLGPGSRLQVEGTVVGVAGWIIYDEEWVEYLLTDTTWLCVEKDDSLELSRWWDRAGRAPDPGDTIVVEGHSYREIETYQARWRAAGIGDLPPAGRVWVAEYENVHDPSYLAALEDWGDGPELSIGKKLSVSDVAEI